MKSIIKLTYLEYANRKIFLISLILYGLVLLVLLFGFGKNIEYFTHWYFLSFIFYFTLILLLLSGFDTVPKMIEDGSVELLLARPPGRAKLLLYKYASALLIIPISTFIFFLIISIIYLIKSGTYDLIFIRAFVFVLITFAIYYATLLPATLILYRSSLNLVICLMLIMANVVPNVVGWMTIGQIDIRGNLIINFFYIISPRLVELCSLGINSENGSFLTIIYSAAHVLICLMMSLAIFVRKDF